MCDSLSRREFMESAALSAAAISAPVAMSSASMQTTSAAPRAIKKSLKFPMVRTEGTILEKFKLLRAIGFHGVELDSPSNLDRDEVLRAKDETRLAIPGVIDSKHWSKPLSHPDPNVRAEGRRALEIALHDAKAYGATTVLLVPAVVNKEVSYDDAYERSQIEIRKVLPLAEELGVKIAIENVWNNFLLSPLEAARYIDDFDHPMLGWYFDVGNIVNYGWPEHWIHVLGKRILKLDIKEFSRKKRNDEGLWKGFGVKLLEGDCDWPAVMKALDEIGYSGWASAEVPGGGEERLREIAERMDRILVS
ncbi:MAG: sugar phosphate isomerase/epimerase [Planctomycetes bacterium]|nr:sugar phosphate isomerase/epimerase [Planctomycetota bacterium]